MRLVVVDEFRRRDFIAVMYEAPEEILQPSLTGPLLYVTFLDNSQIPEYPRY